MGKVMINDDFKRQIDSKFDWFSVTNQKKYGNRHHSNQDVTINRCSPRTPDAKNQQIRYNFTMRNKTSLVLGEWIDIAIYKNRVFFRPSTQKDGGYKMYCHNNSKSKTNPFLQIPETETTKGLIDFVGDYDMHYDDFYELYYIEKPVEK